MEKIPVPYKNLPDLLLAACEHPDAAHLDHGVGEVLPEVGPEEGAEEARVGVDDVDGGCVVVEHCVRGDDGKAIAEDGGVEGALTAAVKEDEEACRRAHRVNRCTHLPFTYVYP